MKGVFITADDLNLTTSFVFDVANELMTYVSDIVVKRDDLAHMYETLESATAWDLYITALKKNDAFMTYSSYSIDLLLAAGVPYAYAITGSLDKMEIPVEYRDAVLLAQREVIISNYEEQNNYYRMLNGKPDYNETVFVYVYDNVPGVDISKPVHLMTDDEITILRISGYINTLSTNYPKFKYLNYLGNKKIGILASRHAAKFDILRTGYISNVLLKKRFNLNYEISKTYILNNFYKKTLSLDNTYFEAYIGLLILTNALIMTVNSSVDIFNSKEVTNDQTIKAVLASHGLDVFDDIPSIYRKNIADNIESIIVSKGSDEVIAKIFKACGFSDIQIRKFVLVKEHLKDANDRYIFAYDNDGVTPRYDDMYDIYFSQVNITEQNIFNEIQKPENKLGYFDVVDNDIYWGAYESNESIRQLLLKENFNYIDTDYLNINTAYSVSKLTTELSYFFSMIIDLKSYINELMFIEPFFGSNISLFYSIVMLAALLSKKIGWNGEIITDPDSIATVYKFNFSSNISHINEILTKYSVTSKTANELMAIIPHDNIENTKALVDLYFNNEDVLTKITKLMSETKDLDDYLALREIYEYVMMGKTSTTAFTKADGTIAATYLDFLSSYNSVIATYINSLSTIDDIDATIRRLLNTLEAYIDTANFDYLFLKIPSFSSENIFKVFISKIINIFKAFNINIFSMTVTYNIDDNKDDMKIMDTYYYGGNMTNHYNVSLSDSIGFHSSSNRDETVRIRDSIECVDNTGYIFYF